MKRIVLLLLQMCLKIAIIVENCGHHCFLRICKVIADVFQLPVTHLLNDSPPKDGESQEISSKLSISTQTEENINQHENTAKKPGTDVIIYNLNSAQKLVISQEKCKRSHYRSATRTPSEENKDETTQTEFQNLYTSCMSIESSILDSNIENGDSNSSNSSQEKVTLESTREGFNSLHINTRSLDNETLNADNTKDSNSFNTSSNTYKYRFISPIDIKYEKNAANATYLHAQKTSSPLQTLQSTQTQCTNLSMFSAHHQSRTKDTEKSVNSDSRKKEVFTSNFRRLSLPVKLNTTNNSAINFKLAQQKLIEETLKNTPRHEKSVKKIKYPFSSDISLDGKPNDGMEDKEVFSCSSYESLPVSDHLRNAFENNMLLNTCNESLYSEEIPDLLPVDDLVEDFNDIQRSLSVNITQSTITPATLSKVETESETDSYIGNNLQQSFLQSTSSNSNVLKEYPKQTNNFKKRMISSFTSEDNFSVSDRCKEFDNFVDSNMNISEKFCYKGLTDLESEINSDNNESDMNESRSNHSQIQNKFDQPSLKREIEEALEKCTFSSDASEYFENISNVIDSMQTKPPVYHKYFYQILQQSEDDILLIEEDPSHEKSQTIKDVSESFSNEDDKTFCKENVSRKPKEISNFVEYEDLLPKQLHNSFVKLAEYSENQSNKMEYKSSENPNESMPLDKLQCGGHSENPVLIVEDKGESNDGDNLEQNLQQFDKEFNESLLHETRSTNQCLSEENSQNDTLKDQKPDLHRKKSKRSKRSRNKAKNSDLQTQSPVKQSSPAILSDEKSPRNENEACQNILELSCENEEKNTSPSEKNNSSGDSASDNSVVTVKELSAEEGKTEESLPSENCC